MTITSSPVAPGDTITAAGHNALWNDLTQSSGHNHDGEGGTVDHASLGESGEMSGQYHTHSDIELHMNGTDQDFDDTPGGAKGVHGLGSAANVAGAMPRQYVISAGKKSSPGTSGTIYFSENGASPGNAFSEVVSVTMVPQHSSAISCTVIVGAVGGAKDSCTYYIEGTTPTAIYFVVVGTRV